MEWVTPGGIAERFRQVKRYRGGGARFRQSFWKMGPSLDGLWHSYAFFRASTARRPVFADGKESSRNGQKAIDWPGKSWPGRTALSRCGVKR